MKICHTRPEKQAEPDYVGQHTPAVRYATLRPLTGIGRRVFRAAGVKISH